MSTVTIKGTFKTSNNNDIDIAIYGPGHYIFREQYQSSFSKTLSDLQPGVTYYVTFKGDTTGKFKFELTGDTNDTMDEDYSNQFIGGEPFKTI